MVGQEGWEASLVLLVPGWSTGATVTSLLRGQGAAAPPGVWGAGVSPHTGVNPLTVNSPGLQGCHEDTHTTQL